MFCLPTDWPSIIEVHLITGVICTSNRYLRDLLLSSSQSVCVTFTNYDVNNCKVQMSLSLSLSLSLLHYIFLSPQKQSPTTET